MRTNQLFKLSGVLLIIGGLLYIGIQLIHPADELASVETTLYIGVAIATSIMSAFIFMGVLGLYIKHSVHLGILGMTGTLLFGVFWIISMIFSFNEAFILPLVKDTSTEFVVGMTGLFAQVEVSADLGIFPQLAVIAGLMYVIGGTLLGLSLYKYKVFSRIRAILLMAASILTLASGAIPHPFDRGLAIPMGLAFLGLGCSLIQGETGRDS